MPIDQEYSNVIAQITATKSLFRTKTKDGITVVYKASAELGEFKMQNGSVVAKRYSDAGIVRNKFSSEEVALDWITENK